MQASRLSSGRRRTLPLALESCAIPRRSFSAGGSAVTVAGADGR
jgi:hypothetical protein